MIVELIGCAGAGKTSLRRHLCRAGVGGRPTVALSDLATDRPGLRRLGHPTAINLAQELIAAPHFVRAARRDPSFLRFATTRLQDAPSRLEAANTLRGLLRKVGMFELARERAGEVICISDEGTLLSAYNLLVRSRHGYRPADVERFASLVPMPDVVVLVRAPLPELAERAIRRPDPRRQHRGRPRPVIERDVARTAALFEALAATAPVAGRVLITENGGGDHASVAARAAELGDRLRRRTVPPHAAPLLAGPPARTPAAGGVPC